MTLHLPLLGLPRYFAQKLHQPVEREILASTGEGDTRRAHEKIFTCGAPIPTGIG